MADTTSRVSPTAVLKLSGTFVYADKAGNVIKTVDFMTALEGIEAAMPGETDALAAKTDTAAVRLPYVKPAPKPEASASDPDLVR